MHWWDTVVYRFVKYVELNEAFEHAFLKDDIAWLWHANFVIRRDDEPALARVVGNFSNNFAKEEFNS